MPAPGATRLAGSHVRSTTAAQQLPGGTPTPGPAGTPLCAEGDPLSTAPGPHGWSAASPLLDGSSGSPLGVSRHDSFGFPRKTIWAAPASRQGCAGPAPIAGSWARAGAGGNCHESLPTLLSKAPGWLASHPLHPLQTPPVPDKSSKRPKLPL